MHRLDLGPPSRKRPPPPSLSFFGEDAGASESQRRVVRSSGPARHPVGVSVGVRNTQADAAIEHLEDEMDIELPELEDVEDVGLTTTRVFFSAGDAGTGTEHGQRRAATEKNWTDRRPGLRRDALSMAQSHTDFSEARWKADVERFQGAIDLRVPRCTRCYTPDCKKISSCQVQLITNDYAVRLVVPVFHCEL